MIEDPTIASLRAFRMEITLGKAINLSNLQAHETWRAMQLIAREGSVEGLPGNLIQTAMEFNRCPPAWKVVADKALGSRLITRRNPQLAAKFIILSFRSFSMRNERELPLAF